MHVHARTAHTSITTGIASITEVFLSKFILMYLCVCIYLYTY